MRSYLTLVGSIGRTIINYIITPLAHIIQETEGGGFRGGGLYICIIFLNKLNVYIQPFSYKDPSTGVCLPA